MINVSDDPLWEELKKSLRDAARIWGAPRDLWGEHVLPRADTRLLRGWLAALETIARALLMIMAVRLPDLPPERSPRRVCGRPKQTSVAPRCSPRGLFRPGEPYDSDRWAGVAFRIAPNAGSGERGAGRRTPASRFDFVHGLALRFEALIRVAENPRPYARRLARRLRAEPGLAAVILSPAENPRGANRGWRPLAELVEEALSAARAIGPPARETG
jgi:hypothetical protein